MSNHLLGCPNPIFSTVLAVVNRHLLSIPSHHHQYHHHYYCHCYYHDHCFQHRKNCQHCKNCNIARIVNGVPCSSFLGLLNQISRVVCLNCQRWHNCHKGSQVSGVTSLQKFLFRVFTKSSCFSPWVCHCLLVDLVISHHHSDQMSQRSHSQVSMIAL